MFGSSSQMNLGLKDPIMRNSQDFSTQMGQFRISVDSTMVVQPSATRTGAAPEENMNQTKLSFKSLGGQTSISNGSNTTAANNNEAVFYESEYFYSSMPVLLPSSYQDGKPMVVIEDSLRPYTPSQRSQLAKSDAKSMNSRYSSVISLSQCSYSKAKI